MRRWMVVVIALGACSKKQDAGGAAPGSGSAAGSGSATVSAPIAGSASGAVAAGSGAATGSSATSGSAASPDAAVAKVPDCIQPGRYTLSVVNVKKWAREGKSLFDETCEENAGVHAPMLRVAVRDGEVFVDEVEPSDPFAKRTSAKVTRTGDCEADISLELADFKLARAHVMFAGDALKGTTTDFTFDIIEDGDAGENTWSCSTKQGDVIARRAGD